MPRFFFHLADGTREPDHEGVDLPNVDAARKEAVVYAGETLKENPSRLWDGGELKIEVTDENGLMLFLIAIAAIEAPAFEQTR